MYMATLLLGLSACDRDAHEDEYPMPEEHGGLVVGLQTDADVTARDIHYFLFNASERLTHHEYFDDPGKAALHVSYLNEGTYTAVAVLNAGADFMPPSTRSQSTLPDITLSEFAGWLKMIVGQYSELLTGIGSVKVEQGKMAHLTITLQGGTGGITLCSLRLLFTAPGAQLPDHTSAKRKTRAADAGYILRCVAELCKAGTDETVLHLPVTPVLQADGVTYLVNLSANQGDYDLRLWADYVPTGALLADTYYHTGDLKAVGIVTEPYTANTDAKDAVYYAQSGITLPEEGAEIRVELQRPLAKYRLVATDIDRYQNLMQTNDYPPLEELTVHVQYEGFFPSGFNVASGKPNNAVNGSAIFYQQPLPAVTDGGTEVQIASDWVLVNGTESSVVSTVVMKDRDGNEISRVSGVRIEYRRGHLTTLRGEFLSAGKSGGGIHIDTEWDGEYTVDF